MLLLRRAFMTRYLIIAIVVSVAFCGVYLKGRSDGELMLLGKQAEIKQAIADTREQAAIGAAQAIAKIEVKNVTIRQTVERITRENVVYRECRHSDDGLRLVNAALAGKPESAADRQLPRLDATE